MADQPDTAVAWRLNEYLRAHFQPSQGATAVVGVPQLVEPYNAPPGAAAFWRVPIRNSITDRVVGFMDIRNLDDIDVSPLRISRIAIKRAGESAGEKTAEDTLELDEEQVALQAQMDFGSDVQLVAPPRLVYDRAETRVAWLAEVQREHHRFQILVTPGYSYEAAFGDTN